MRRETLGDTSLVTTNQLLVVQHFKVTCNNHRRLHVYACDEWHLLLHVSRGDMWLTERVYEASFPLVLPLREKMAQL